VDALEINTVFVITLLGHEVPITETVVVSWAVMLVLIVFSFIFTRRLKERPSGFQAVMETGVEFLYGFAKKQFGYLAKFLAPYMGTLFLFLLLANIVGVLSPVEISFFGLEFKPPFVIRPPTRDINVTGALAAITILLVPVCGIAAKGFLGWLKHFMYPLPAMLPFNIMDYGTRLASLSLRLFGNILGGVIMMRMIEGAIPLAVPMVFSLYFDFFDGLMQAFIFVFLTSLYISEVVSDHNE
jgi:F-type H+-transporting ATPase subunit a